MNPNVSIKAYLADVKSHDFGVSYFKQFTLVLNALDNTGARQHVNRMCLQAQVPLIESGTEGYLGQVTVIRGGVYECFDCNPQPPEKSYAICTIRSNPSTPIHCIVWAKKLFGDLFGANNETSEVFEHSDAPDDAETQQEIDLLAPFDQTAQYALWLFHKAFAKDIMRLNRVGAKLFEKRAPPKPLLYAELADGQQQQQQQQQSAQLQDQRVWNVKESAQVFIDSVDKLNTRKPLTWDKDDSDSLGMLRAVLQLHCAAAEA
jgi:ubiquitin-like 1-activating enzyme E1 B